MNTIITLAILFVLGRRALKMEQESAITEDTMVMDVTSEPLQVESEQSDKQHIAGTPEPESNCTSEINPPLPQASSRARMLERVANSDGHFKHQQIGDPDLSPSEKTKIATDLLDTKPAVFLTRFGKYLETEDLVNFQSLSEDYMIKFHLEEIRKRLNVHKNQTVVRNRRYEAMKRLVAEGEYFGDEELKHRDPLLYEQMVGQHLNDEEISAQVNKSDLRFSTILLRNLDMYQNNDLYKTQVDKEVRQCFCMIMWASCR